MQSVILAAGKGKRLQPLTDNISKAMAPIAGKPMLQRVLEALRQVGISEFILVVDPKDKLLIDYFKLYQDQESRTVKITFVFQENQLGMAHALLQAAPFIHDRFLLSACDNLIRPDDLATLVQKFSQDRESTGCLILMEIPKDKVSSISTVAFDGRWVSRIVEKPRPDEVISNLGSIALYCFTPDILGYLTQIAPSPRGEYELQDAIQMLIDRQGGVAGFVIKSRQTLTNMSDYLNLNLGFLSRSPRKYEVFTSDIGESSVLNAPIYIEADVKIGERCVIGPDVFVAKGSVIYDDVVLTRSVVLKGGIILSGATIESQVVFGKSE